MIQTVIKMRYQGEYLNKMVDSTTSLSFLTTEMAECRLSVTLCQASDCSVELVGGGDVK